MTGAEAAAILGAGIAAGAINTVVGSGTLVSFPVLLGVGFSPVTANVTNTLGLAPGSLTGAYGYRRELRGQRARAVRLGVASALGGLVGAVLLLTLPASAFKAIVPALIAIALVLVLAQPRLARRLAARRAAEAAAADQAGAQQDERVPAGGPVTVLAVFATGVYGGYFGAAQGVLLLAILGIAFHEDLQRHNAVKNVLATVVNLTAAVVFLFAAHVALPAALVLAAGAVVGGLIGARIGRRLPPAVLRAVIVAVGVVAIVKLLTS